jgi:hypothetical protein
METNFIKCLFLLHCSLILFGLQSCSLIQQSNKKTAKESSSNYQKESTKQLEKSVKNIEIKEISIEYNSSHTSYSILIWPKGKFSLSKEKGFEGEAEKIAWSRQNSTLTSL